MNFADFSWTTLVYITIFTGCYVYFTWNLPHRAGKLLSALALACGLAFVYTRRESSFQVLLIRYVVFAVVYSVWSFAFLRVQSQYAFYLSIFFTIFMGVWISCVQVILYAFGITDRTVLTLSTGVCRILSIVLIKRFFIRVDAARCITLREMLVSLFPAIACFVANLEAYDYLGFLTRYAQEQSTLFIHLSVIFFGFSAMLVLLSSESYFQFICYREENERAQRQLEAQYQLFLREKESAEKMRALHHDLKNHLDTIEAMMKPGDVAVYVSNLREAEREAETPFSTGCPTLDALLTAKLPALREKGIELSCLIHFTKADFLTPMEICTLFANSLDNAIEAIANGGLEAEKRIIRLSGGEINGNMIVRIENAYCHTLCREGGSLLTTKANSTRHGYGLTNMRNVIEKHGGTMTYKTENGVFSLFFMIPMHSKSVSES